MPNRPPRLLSFSNFLIAIVLAAAPAAHATPTFTILPSAGGLTPNFAQGISADGQVVVGQGTIGSDRHAFRWTATGGLQDLGTISGAANSNAWAVSGDGSVVVGDSSNGTPTDAAVWNAVDGMQPLTSGTAFDLRRVLDANQDGSIVVGTGWESGVGNEAFLWSETDGITRLGHLFCCDSQARGVTPDGSVVVGRSRSVSSTTGEPFMWTEGGGMVTLGGGSGTAEAISADGLTVVGGPDAWRWTLATGRVDLDWGFYDESRAMDVSADGSVIVGWKNFSDDPREAVFYTEADGWRFLKDILEDDLGFDLTGVELQEALAVSEDGLTVAGVAKVGSATRAFVVFLPEPAAGSLWGLTILLGLGVARRRG